MADENPNINRYSRQEADNANNITQQARSLTEELKDQLGIRSRLNETQRETLNLARQLQRSAQDNNVEIGNSGNIQRQLNKDKKIFNGLDRELKGVRKDITENIKLELELLKEAGELGEEAYIRAFAAADQETQKIALLEKALETSNKLIQSRNKEAEIQKDINDRMGVTGAVVKGTGALMERLGMRSGIFNDAMNDASERMREMAEESVRVDESTGKTLENFTKTEIMLEGLSKLSKGFKKALFDPAVISAKILDAFFEVNKQQVDFIRYTGQASASLGGVNTEVASMTDMLKTATEFTRQTGLNAAAIFTPQQIGQIADATELLGLSAEQGTKLGMVMKQTGKSVKEIEAGISANVDIGVSQKAVYDDILKTSDDIVASSGGSEKALARAASAARKLGMDLAKVNQIADGLLDFESSIQAELEAQLLTGKQINLNKARELALNNDLEGVAEELSKNGASAAEFAKMNRIQQQGLAKALGISRAELGKMVLTEKAMANMTEDQIAAARGVTLEQSRQMDIQAKIQKSVDRLAQAFAPILEAVVPIVEALLNMIKPLAAGVGYLLKFKAVSYALTGIFTAIAVSMAGMRLANFAGVGVRGFNAMRESLTGMGKGLKGFTGLLGKAKEGIKTAFLKGKSGDITETASDAASKASKSTKNITQGKNVKTFLGNLSEGLKDMAGGKVLQGALNLIPASIGLVAMIPGVVGAKLMEVINGQKLQESMYGLAYGLEAMGKGKVLLGTLGLTAAAIAFTLMIPASAGMALLGLTAPMAAAGLDALIPALTALGTAMTTGVAALGLIALIGMAVGMGAAFALVGAGAMMLGKGIQFAAQGFVSIFSQLGTLVTMLPQLYLLGGALLSIAAGLGAIAYAGIAAIPALAALGTLAVMSAPLVALGGLFRDGDNNSDGFAKLEAKLDTLISVVSAGGDVYLDGDKVGSAQVIGTYKLQ